MSAVRTCLQMPEVPSPEKEEDTRILASLSNGITMLSIVRLHVRALLKTFGDCHPNLFKRELGIVEFAVEIVLIQRQRYIGYSAFT